MQLEEAEVPLNYALLGRPRERAGKFTLVCKRRVAESRYLCIPVLTFYLETDSAGVDFLPLAQFCKQHRSMSYTWQYQTVKGVALLVEFVGCRRQYYQRVSKLKPRAKIGKRIAREFAHALVNGSIVQTDHGIADPDDLWWLPRSATQAKKLFRGAIRYLEWSEAEEGRSALEFLGLDQSFHGASEWKWNLGQRIRRNTRQLAHIRPTNQKPVHWGATSSIGEPVRESQTHGFPSEYIPEFLFEGFRYRSGEEDETAQLIAVILIMGGLRTSEPFHFWVNDYAASETGPHLYLRHPVHYPVNLEGGGRITRLRYLARYNLTPRNMLRDEFAAGWKGVSRDMEDARVHWLNFEGLENYLTTSLAKYLFVTRPKIMYGRRALGLPDHPWLFVGNGLHSANSQTKIGDPYTISAFRASWARNVDRLAAKHNDPKLTHHQPNGTTPHGARHRYGLTLADNGVSIDGIKHGMHHRSIFSQIPYRQRSPEEWDAIFRGDKSAVDRIQAEKQEMERYLQSAKWR